jgi:hypothetical protein
MKLRSKDGIEMMEVKSIDLDEEKLVVKGKMMGTMAATILVSPEDLWAAYRLLSPGAVMRLPVLLAKGWARSRKKTS